MIIDWKTLYNTSDMTDMRDMIAPINRLILTLEDSKTKETSKDILQVDHYLITEINKAQSFWRGILDMVSYQRKD